MNLRNDKDFRSTFVVVVVAFVHAQEPSSTNFHSTFLGDSYLYAYYLMHLSFLVV
jgi:hypothetical protein